MLNKKLGLTLITFLSVGLVAHKAFAASDTGTATATVISPLAIAADQDLAFGSLDAGTGGTVVMTALGARSATGGVFLSPSDAGNQGTFDVTGTGTSTYTVTLPANGVVTLTSGANSMDVGTFTSNPSGTGALVGGAQVLAVGATLTVASAQAPGVYSGTYTVTVEYN